MNSTPRPRKRRSSFGMTDSSPFDSPSKQLVNEQRRRKGLRKSYEGVEEIDSPARQLQRELNRQLYESDTRFVRKLNEAARKAEEEHNEAIRQAQENQDRVRKTAEAALERTRLEYEAQRQAEIDRIEAQKAEIERAERRRQIEEAERQEAARQQQIREEREIAEKEELIRQQRRQFEAEEAQRVAQRERERQAEEDRKAHEQRQAAEREAAAKAAAQPPLPPNQPAESRPTANAISISSSGEDKEGVHKRYLEIHNRLKTMRKDALKVLKQQPGLKTALGDMRRDIRKICGQFSTVRENNIKCNKALADIMKKAQSHTNPTVDARQYMVSPPPSEIPIPLCLLYLLNIFTKSIIASFMTNGGNPKNNITVAPSVVYIFGDPQYVVGGHTLIDILLAKVHKVCPVLFGITGNEQTKAGRIQLGWGREHPGGPFVDDQTQGDRMAGFGAGWASMTLRDLPPAAISRGRINPLPPRVFWASVASILNTPPDQITRCHLWVLRSMLEFSVDRFVLFYGHAALAAIRRAAIDLPKAVAQNPASHALGMLGEILNKEYNITI